VGGSPGRREWCPSLPSTRSPELCSWCVQRLAAELGVKELVTPSSHTLFDPDETISRVSPRPGTPQSPRQARVLLAVRPVPVPRRVSRPSLSPASSERPRLLVGLESGAPSLCIAPACVGP
jgi:hypothetical protein